MIYVNDIINVCNGKCTNIDLNMECTDFSYDTRELKKDDIYVGIKGETLNGNKFYIDAINKGAKLCILDSDTIVEEKYKDKIIFVDDTIEAIHKLAKYKREKYNIPVVAVTGSVGKTSVKDMIAAVLRKKYNVLCSVGNKNNHIGMPFTVLALKDHNALVVEMGMNHFGEIHTLTNIAKPTIGVITNIGTAHIGILGSRENILKAKLEILDGMDNNSYLIINNDNDLLQTVKYDNLITVGIDNQSDYMAKDISTDAFSSTFSIEDNYMTIPIGGECFIRNALLAYAVGRKLGISTYDIEDALENIILTPHRLEVIKNNDITIIDDTYNASLDSVKNAAELLNKVSSRKVFIFADILELDDYSEEIHKEIGKIFLENNIDLLLTVGSLTKYTHDVFKEKNKNCFHFNNNEELLKEINTLLKKDDIILIKGSHSMNLIEIVDYLKNKK